ncbi:DUF1440 domain-containing protein [Deinococcus peraridilitoris]|nr:DUF1440 domain-containing protein [Deinococcus peraridilitoris]
MNDAAKPGAIGGFAGGALMTLMIQEVAPKVLPKDMEPGHFAPKLAVQWGERLVGQPNLLNDRQEMLAALAVHLGYSAFMGSFYGRVRDEHRSLPVPAAGALFGLIVWAISFEGWMPAVGIMKRTTDEPPRKWPAPLMGHVIYGVGTALVFHALHGRRKK